MSAALLVNFSQPPLRQRQRFVQRFEQVVRMLETDGQANEIRRKTAVALLLLGELRVRGTGGMKNQALGVAHVRQVREELDVVDDLHRRRVAALDAEDDHAAEAILEDLTLSLIHI